MFNHTLRIGVVFTALTFPIPVWAGTVYLDGPIDSQIVDYTLAKLRPGDTLALNSQGGSLSDAHRLAKYIRANGIDTRVNSTGWCLSACVLVYASGVKRTAGPNALFLIHAVRNLDGPTKEGTSWFLDQLVGYGVSERVAYLPVFKDDEVPMNYVLAKYVGLVTD